MRRIFGADGTAHGDGGGDGGGSPQSDDLARFWALSSTLPEPHDRIFVQVARVPRASRPRPFYTDRVHRAPSSS